MRVVRGLDDWYFGFVVQFVWVQLVCLYVGGVDDVGCVDVELCVGFFVMYLCVCCAWEQFQCFDAVGCYCVEALGFGEHGQYELHVVGLVVVEQVVVGWVVGG